MHCACSCHCALRDGKAELGTQADAAAAWSTGSSPERMRAVNCSTLRLLRKPWNGSRASSATSAAQMSSSSLVVLFHSVFQVHFLSCF